jgi:GntR family transcriptional repressor for pyruvate dehydrogenase complex
MTLPQFQSIGPGARLSDRVAEALSNELRSGRIPPGTRIPTEIALAGQFGVSRTVIREAVSQVKSLGLLASRQGSGVYAQEAGFLPLSFDPRHARSHEAVIQIVEVRRGLESEVAALAAERRCEADLQAIHQCITQLSRAVAAGGDGVDEDIAFHRSIAAAARNPFLIVTLDYLGQFLRGATQVTRANEARRVDFAEQVRAEHAAILKAIESADPFAAREAAGGHMRNAMRRIESADPSFWSQEGESLAQPLLSALTVTT